MGRTARDHPGGGRLAPLRQPEAAGAARRGPGAAPGGSRPRPPWLATRYHNHNKEHHENIGFFGFFECINDQTVANALFDAARDYLKSKGVTAMRGPANPSVNDEYALLIEGFDIRATVLMTYNPQYYVTFIENYGFVKAKDLYAYFLSQETVYSERFNRANALVKARNSLTVRPMYMKHFKADVEIVKHLYNAAWAKNWGAVPMTDAEMDALAADLKPIVIPDLVLFAECLNVFVGDLRYLQQVWEYHHQITEAICNGDYKSGYEALVAHTDLLYQRP